MQVMMRKYKLFILFLLFWSQMAVAQQIVDDELQSLVAVVKMLRNSNENTFNHASKLLASDEKWTPMSELGVRQSTECLPVDRVAGFKLNRILSKVEGNRKFVYTHGDMLNGEDERYNYSLYERSVKAGQNVSYRLKGREGTQIFVLIPFHGEQSGLSGEIQLEQEDPVVFQLENETDRDVMSARIVSSELTREKEIVLTIRNGSSENQSFVLINYNSRK